jgi:hypothetical protein
MPWGNLGNGSKPDNHRTLQALDDKWAELWPGDKKSLDMEVEAPARSGQYRVRVTYLVYKKPGKHEVERVFNGYTMMVVEPAPVSPTTAISNQ